MLPHVVRVKGEEQSGIFGGQEFISQSAPRAVRVITVCSPTRYCGSAAGNAENRNMLEMVEAVGAAPTTLILQGSAPPWRRPRCFLGRLEERCRFELLPLRTPWFSRPIAPHWRGPLLNRMAEGTGIEPMRPGLGRLPVSNRTPYHSANLPVRKIDSMTLPALGLGRVQWWLDALLLPPCGGHGDCPIQDFRRST